MKELQPTCIEDIIAAVSLYRPGPMDSIPRYIKNKHNPQETTYDHPILESILNVTYGCIVYQEQVMRIVQDMAGYTLGQADMVRRMMGKKKMDAMIAERQVFLYGKPAENGKPAIDGAIKRGVPEDVANKVWSEMESFASYAFNKSHSAAYSYITYQTAYLKTYYEPEFLTSLLNNRITNAEEIKNYVTYAKEEKIDVLPPDINKSETYFSVKNNQIRFGIAALKNVGIGVVDSIIAERNQNGEYKSFPDFINRIDAQAHNKRCIESLILSGACDCFGVKRSQLMRVYPEIIERVAGDRRRQASGQFSMFETLIEDVDDEVVYPNIPEFDNQTKLKLEKEVVGVYISGHPLSPYMDRFNAYNLTSDMFQTDEEEGMSVDEEETREVNYTGLTDGMEVACGGIIADVKKVLTKRNNQEMGIVKIEDLYGTIDLMLFPTVYAKFKNILVPDALVTIKGKLSVRSDETPCVLVDNVTKWEDTKVEESVSVAPQKKLYLMFNLEDKTVYNGVMDILNNYPGGTPVIVKNTADGKPYRLGVHIEPNSYLTNELHAYINDDFIKLV